MKQIRVKGCTNDEVWVDTRNIPTHIRINQSAGRILTRLGKQTGLPTSQVASEIIIQAEPFIEIVEVDD